MSEITQQELARYFDLMKREKRIKAKRLELRQSLIERFTNHTPVQNGKYRITVSYAVCRPISKQVLVDVKGEEFYKELYALIPQVERQNLRVWGSKTS